MTNHYAPSPHEWPPLKVAAPKSLKGTDLFPAVTLTATRPQVKMFGDVVEQEDELGTCLVAHFEVFGTLIIFYQSALDDKDYWTVFVDMVSCVGKEQFPTKLGIAVVRQLTAGAIKPDWQNDDADTEYRSRRRRPSQVGDSVTKLIKKRVTPLGDLRPARAKSPLEAANDWTMVKVANASARRFVAAKKAAPAKRLAVKKAAASAKKPAVAKRTAPAKKAAPPKRSR